MKEIPLTRGMVALVDDEDYELVSQFRWCVLADKAGKRFYARRATNKGGIHKSIRLHRFLMDAPDDVDVDHVDGNGLNCQRFNMRIATRQQNCWNSTGKPGSTSEYKGVFSVDNGATWNAYLAQNDRLYSLGRYESEEAAAQAHDAAAVQLRGEFAWTNFPDLQRWAIDLAAHVIAGGRAPRKPRALSDSDVIAMRRRYAQGGVLMRELADQYRVTTGAIGHALQGRTFAHITDPAPLTFDKRRKAA